ncbi:hypothetical protein FRB95_008582 [Tulasnella sp. JGI-2019a]|nr:hypothetical protein FRB95_008582 [Tulasnella sp. JGI-2019a]
MLCLGKLIQDLIRSRNRQIVLRGTLSGELVGSDQHMVAKITTQVVLRVLGPPEELGSQVSWQMENFLKRLEDAKVINLPKFLLRPYSQPSPFSVNLTLKSLRQGYFAKVLSNMGWLVGSVPNATQVRKLEDATSGYRVFLRRPPTKEAPGGFATELVDMVWHTHQLLGDEYRSQSIEFVGQFPDHVSMEEFVAAGRNPYSDAVVRAQRSHDDSEGSVRNKSWERPYCSQSRPGFGGELLSRLGADNRIDRLRGLEIRCLDVLLL